MRSGRVERDGKIKREPMLSVTIIARNEAHDIQACLELWLRQLNDKQREVVEYRFGLHGREVATLEEVGNELGVTLERVRQIQLEALKRLREIMEREGYSVDNILK